MSEEQLWDPGQEWIQIFDNLLKHPQELKLFFVLYTTGPQDCGACPAF